MQDFNNQFNTPTDFTVTLRLKRKKAKNTARGL